MSATGLRWALPVSLVIALAYSGCGESGLRPAAERGRQIYLAQCTACHHVDPAQAGPLGPQVKGASRELLEAKLLRGTYPPGYTPARPTRAMPVLPSLAPEVAALAEYLK